MIPLESCAIFLIATTIGCFAQNFSPSERCNAPPLTGNCRAHIPARFFNSTSDKCERFIYGGCPVTDHDNLFESRSECIRGCQPEACSLHAETGPCKASVRLWYYDRHLHPCLEFTYGGCDGNENKFTTQEDCEAASTTAPGSCGSKFSLVGRKPTKFGYADSKVYMLFCDKRCRDWCVKEHEWGTCKAYSLVRTWYACFCFVFDRQLSTAEQEETAIGLSDNRVC